MPLSKTDHWFINGLSCIGVSPHFHRAFLLGFLCYSALIFLSSALSSLAVCCFSAFSKCALVPISPLFSVWNADNSKAHRFPQIPTIISIQALFPSSMMFNFSRNLLSLGWEGKDRGEKLIFFKCLPRMATDGMSQSLEVAKQKSIINVRLRKGETSWNSVGPRTWTMTSEL